MGGIEKGVVVAISNLEARDGIRGEFTLLVLTKGEFARRDIDQASGHFHGREAIAHFDGGLVDGRQNHCAVPSLDGELLGGMKWQREREDGEDVFHGMSSMRKKCFVSVGESAVQVARPVLVFTR